MNRRREKYFAGGHTIDPVTGCCTSCKATIEEMEDNTTPVACPGAHGTPAHAVMSLWNVVRADFEKT